MSDGNQPHLPITIPTASLEAARVASKIAHHDETNTAIMLNTQHFTDPMAAIHAALAAAYTTDNLQDLHIVTLEANENQYGSLHYTSDPFRIAATNIAIVTVHANHDLDENFDDNGMFLVRLQRLNLLSEQVEQRARADGPATSPLHTFLLITPES